jgi:two-component system LytT family response regulator
MLKAVIVEDELNSAENLKILAEEFCSGVKVIGMASSVGEAAELITSGEPDVVFLDINLKGESGFDLLSRMKTRNFAVVFTTAYSDYALPAFRVSALDYLLKPINIVQLREAVEKVRLNKNNDISHKLEKLVDQLKTHDPATKIILPTLGGLNFINSNDVVYCESDSNYTTFYLLNGQKHIVSKTMKSFTNCLSAEHFFRIHNSYIINLKYIKKYNKGDGTITMENNQVLEVSKRKRESFLMKIGIKISCL